MGELGGVSIETAVEYMYDLHDLMRFYSREGRQAMASKSEIRRWLKNGAIHINGKAIGPDDFIEYPIISLVMFPKSKKQRCTIF